MPELTCKQCGGRVSVCGHVAADLIALAEARQKLQAAEDVLRRAAFSWGDEEADTCGVCQKHFAECEDEQLCVPANASEQDLDLPTGREFACAGARARRVLKGLPQLL